MKTLNYLFFTLALFMFSGTVNAQDEEMKPKKYDNPEWYYVVYIDYETGKFQKAMDIVENYYMKATKSANLPGPYMVMEMNSGEYDLMVVWKLKDGLDSMNWEISPDDIKWRQAFTKLVGDKEKADKIHEEYQSYVRSSIGQLARKKW